MTTGETFRMDPCGECVEGKCDGCDECLWFAALPGAKPQEGTWFGDLRPQGADDNGADAVTTTSPDREETL